VRLGVLILVAALGLTGCSAGGATPSQSSTPVDHSDQAKIDGEWVLTRTVTSTDDVNNPAHAVGSVSTRLLKFDEVTCDNGPCTGTVLSGPTQAARDQGTFTSSGDTITYTLRGFVNCLRQDTGAVLVPNGYSYTSTVTLNVDTTVPENETRAATLTGTMTYTDTLTNEALEAGCSRDPVSTTTEYSLTATTGTVEPTPTPTPTP
jgi:hypothetical protein